MALDVSAVRGDSTAAKRACGTCTLCCKVFSIPEFNKPQGVWCPQCRQGVGCRIYETRPDRCRDYVCGWLADNSIPEEWKPERSKIVLSFSRDNGYIYAVVDPGYPKAWRNAPYYDQLRRWAASLIDKERYVIVSIKQASTLILPNGPFFLGDGKLSYNFRVHQGSNPAGTIYRVEMLDDEQS